MIAGLEAGKRDTFLRPEQGRNRPPHAKSFARYAEKGLLEQCFAPAFDRPCLTFSVGGVQNFVLLDADMIRHCFVQNPKNYGYSPVRQRILKPVFGDGLLAAEGERWKQSRKSISSVFSADNLAAYAETMRRAAERYVADLAIDRAPILLSDTLSRLTFRILSDTLFSGELTRRETDLLAAISRIMDSYDGDDRIDIDFAPYWLPKTRRVANSTAIAECRAILAALIAARLENADPGDDILGRMIGFARADLPNGELARYLEDNIMSFLIPGHETSAIAVSWTLYILSTAPAARQRAAAEAEALHGAKIPAGRWHEAAPFLRACVEEAMRLYPPLPLIARHALGDDCFGTIAIPKGSTVMIATGLLQRQHRYWPDPGRFSPARFLPENRTGHARFAYLPFGVGPKTCIGSGFALREAVILLAAFLRGFDFAYAGKNKPRPMMRVVTRPDNKIPMRLIRR